jgi:hypothetical protein
MTGIWMTGKWENGKVGRKIDGPFSVALLRRVDKNMNTNRLYISLPSIFLPKILLPVFSCHPFSCHWPSAAGARLWSQTQPQHVGLFKRAAAGASAFASLRRDKSHTAAILAFVAFAISPLLIARAETVSIVIASNAAPRVEFGAGKLAEALKAVGMKSVVTCSQQTPGPQYG